MPKLPSSRNHLAGILTCFAVLALIFYYFYDQHLQQAEAQLLLQITTRGEKARLDASTLAILSEIAVDEKMIANPGSDAICIGINDRNQGQDIIDPSPELLHRLKRSVPKIRPNSYCRSLVRGENSFFMQLARPIGNRANTLISKWRKNTLEADKKYAKNTS